jgi:chromatin segregation and condensation protein Rec8/ScpA/Scc1 (kleisin family)
MLPYTGEILDKKTPLLCSMETLSKQTIAGYEKYEVVNIWGSQLKEAYLSTFWASLFGINKKDVQFSNPSFLRNKIPTSDVVPVFFSRSCFFKKP